MNGWGAIQFVGGGFSLVAFIAAAIFYAYRERLQSRAKIINSAPESDRVEAIATEAAFFRVDVAHLSTEQQSNIVLQQLRISSQRNLFLFLSFILLAFLCAAVVLATIISDVIVPPTPKPTPTPNVTECTDPAAQFPETDQTRVSGFTYNATDPGNPHLSTWTRPTEDRWVETASGGVDNLFSVMKRIHIGICDATVVAGIDQPKFQLLISDKNCPTHGFYFRRLPNCDWTGLPPMQNIK
jgi:uncharacterized membrane protein